MLTYHNYSLAHHNTFGISIRCERFIEYTSTQELEEVLAELRATGQPWLHIGGGSNLLFTADFSGTILHSALSDIEVQSLNDQEVLVTVGAGMVWDDFVAWTLRKGFYGLENLSLIPGETGASAVQNIGAYGTEACNHIHQVHTLEAATGNARTFSAEECHYAYRHSIFKGELKGKYVVTAVTYKLQREYQPVLSYTGLLRELERRHIQPGTLTADELRRVIIEIRRAKLPDPQQTGSAGSFFMNPIVSQATYAQLSAIYPDMPHHPAPGGVKLSAGWLIEKAGWKGRSMGQAGVHDQQALVLVNLGGATGEDIMRLAERIQMDVANQFHIQLQPEVIYVG